MKAALTPVQRWALAEGAILLKREDKNQTGSHKDRAARVQVRHWKDQGKRAVLLSSSGNAAKATAAAARACGLRSYAFMSERTPASKVLDVLRYGGTAILSRKPLNLARYVAKNFAIPNLRPSTCDLSIEGFLSLGEELRDHYVRHHGFDSVFTFASSGSSLVAVGRILKELAKAPSLHPVQAGPSCPLAAPDEEPWRIGQAPRTGALCAKQTARRDEARELVTALGGRGWIVTDAEVDEAQSELSEAGFSLCREAAASVAAAIRARNIGWVRRPLVITTGKAVADPQPLTSELPGLIRLDGYLEARRFFDEESRQWSAA